MPYETIRYEAPSETVVRVVLNRAEVHNAQNRQMTYELNDAFDEAVQDNTVRVIILAAAGPNFSAGHDLRERGNGLGHAPVSPWGGAMLAGAEGHMAREEEWYLGMCRRWRNLAKPLIAEVQGRCIAGGLMLVWACDLIIAAADARFSDPVVAMGVNGVEFFNHPWEVGARKAKEMLFTGDDLSAEEARQLGMVNHVVANDELSAFTLALAERVAAKPTFAVKLAKESVNQALDAQGQWTAMQAAFALHQLGHSHNKEMFGTRVDPSGIPDAVRRHP